MDEEEVDADDPDDREEVDDVDDVDEDDGIDELEVADELLMFWPLGELGNCAAAEKPAA